MTDVKEAVLKAKEFAREALGNFDFSLEEIERGRYKENPVWILTLGFPKLNRDPNLNEALKSVSDLFRPSVREYKTFIVDERSGEVIAMKLHDPSIS